MKILITGAKGLVGRALVEHCSTRGDKVFDYDHKSLDIADAHAVESVIAAQRPDAVINCAAWTDVDGCETNPDESRTRKLARTGKPRTRQSRRPARS